MPMNPRLLRPLASGFNPRSISGLALWLDAADGSTLFQNSDGTTPAAATSDPVGYWRDKSGKNRHATQATAGDRPRVAASLTQGLKVVEWYDNGSRMQIATNAVMGNTMSMFAVAKRGPSNWGAGGGGGYGTILSIGTSTAGPAMRANNGIIGMLGGSNESTFTPSGVLGVTSPAIFTGTLNSSDSTLYVNGAFVSSAGAAGSPSAHSATEMGAFSAATGGGGPLRAELAEIITYSRVLTESEKRKVELYLSRKWGIDLAPTATNPEAVDWINRVYANGGTVSTSTANAVDAFCNAIDAAGIRDRFYRLNLFAGAGLNAALVPLYRGPSLAGTQYGNTTDTNNGPFVSGDYAETGASGGLLGNGSSKYLDTGLTVATVGVNGHLAFYHDKTGRSTASSKALGGSTNGSRSQRFVNFASGGIDSLVAVYGDTDIAGDSGILPGFSLATRRSATDLEIYADAVSVDTNAATASVTAITNNFGVFGVLGAGDVATADDGAYGYWNDRIKAYSFGLDMTAQQVSDYYTAMQAFQTALGRNA